MQQSQNITLVSQEGERIKVDNQIKKMIGLLNDMLEDIDNYDEEIPLMNIPSSYLRDIIEYCTHYNFVKVSDIPKPLASNNLAAELKDDWEAQFIARFDLEKLVKMIEYSNFLNVSAIFELCCASLGAMFKGRSFEQVKKEFNIEEEYTPEDEEELQRRFPWI